MNARFRAYWLILVLLSLSVGNISYAQRPAEGFDSFLARFTSSASFQYSRIKFPLESEVLLLDKNEREKSFPFTQEMWPLLDAETFKADRLFLDEEDAYYVSKYVLDEPDRKEFEAGYEESDLDLRVVFTLINGQWFLVDGYTSWYSYDLPAEELREAINQVKAENQSFIQSFP